MRREFVEERQKWEDALTRSAPSTDAWEEEDEDHAMDEDNTADGSLDEYEEDLGTDVGWEETRESQEFYDDEYDEIFAEIAGRSSIEPDANGTGEEGNPRVDSSAGGTVQEDSGMERAQEGQRQEGSHDTEMIDG